jgi:hypothetical protein
MLCIDPDDLMRSPVFSTCAQWLDFSENEADVRYNSGLVLEGTSSSCCSSASSTVRDLYLVRSGADVSSRSQTVEVDGRDPTRHPFRSLVIGGNGSYVPFPSHSFVTYLGPQVYMLLLDCRSVLCELSATLRRLDLSISERSARKTRSAARTSTMQCLTGSGDCLHR